MNIFKSIGAVLAGLVLIFVLSYATDFVLQAAGVIPKGALPLHGADLLIVGILIYRLLFAVLGGYVAARLAPAQPVQHALALGLIGLVLGIAGAIAMEGLAPAWYGWTLAELSVPCVFLGGKLFERSVRPA